MPELRVVWLHATGWTLLVSGGTLLLLTMAATPPPDLRRRLYWIFGAVMIAGVICLGLYFGLNWGMTPADIDPRATF